MIAKEAVLRHPGAACFRFGDSEALCDLLLGLVRAGKKTGTCEALSVFESGAKSPPAIGRRDIALNWDGSAALAVETVALKTCRFDEVEAEFALSEGENDDLEGWRRDHRAYFERSCGFSPDMLLVCETFRVVEDFA